MGNVVRVVALLACAAGGLAGPPPAAAGEAAPVGLFAVDLAIRRGALNDVALVAPDDAWLVGMFKGGAVMHSDGSRWVVVPTPGVGAGAQLLAVSALGHDDIWAVGYAVAGDRVVTVVAHWDGEAWQRIPSPNPSRASNTLYGVAAVSASDVWAVGTQLDDGGYSKTLVEHWDGVRWRTVPSPNPAPTNNYLFDITAVSATDLWAVGNATFDPPGVQSPLVEHWDGTSWTVAAVPPVGATANVLRGVTAIEADDVWAVGHFSDGGSTTQPLVEHWDGSTWSPVQAPTAEVATQLRAVAGESPSNIWAVGFSTDAGGVRHALTEHWDGHTWRVVAAEQVGRGDNFLVGVDTWATLPWGVGFLQARDGQLRSLVELCCAR